MSTEFAEKQALLHQLEEYQQKMAEMQAKNEHLQTRLMKQTHEIEKKEEIYNKEIDCLVLEMEGLEREKLREVNYARDLQKDLEELEVKIEWKNEEFQEVLQQLIDKVTFFDNFILTYIIWIFSLIF